MDFVLFTTNILKVLADVCGSWGVAIIVFTLIIRGVMWQSGVAQQKSARAMQKLQPKLKMVQERYRSNPEEMQKKMAEIYKNAGANPFAGCLPVLIQLPIFMLLYLTLMSPEFIGLAGKTNFLFVSSLDATVKSNTGVSFDGKYELGSSDRFRPDKNAVVYLKDGTIIKDVKINKPNNAFSVQGKVTPGQNVDFKLVKDSLSDLNFKQLDEIQKVELNVRDDITKETETAVFEDRGDILASSTPTVAAKNAFHYDVIALMVIFIFTMWVSMQILNKQNKNIEQDETTKKMQKMMGTVMPIVIIIPFLTIPIPAGVFIYLITSNIFQIVQTAIVNKQIAREEQAENATPDVSGAKKIEAKEIKDAKD